MYIYQSSSNIYCMLCLYVHTGVHYHNFVSVFLFFYVDIFNNYIFCIILFMHT